jgi:hypothetical protein
LNLLHYIFAERILYENLFCFEGLGLAINRERNELIIADLSKRCFNFMSTILELKSVVKHAVRTSAEVYKNQLITSTAVDQELILSRQ